MNDINAFSWNSEIDLIALIINLILGFFLGLVLQFHFKRFGSVLSNRDDIAHILPIITLSVVLIISIVKSSLALSLGLVGALSIVRFRTPIKEPEELAYLFLSIATGLGLGASQRTATLTAFVMIVAFMTFIKFKKRIERNSNIHIFLSWTANRNDSTEGVSEKIEEILFSHCSKVNLRRYESQSKQFELNYIIDIKNTNISMLNKDLNKSFKNINISILDQNNVPKL
jgi:uncharacterized membrane protein YhiD involved in acid resistance